MQILSAKQPLDPATVRRIIKEQGCFVCTDVLGADYVGRAKPALERAIEREVSYHGTTEFGDYGMVLVCALYGETFWEPFENPRLMGPFEAVLGEGCIVYAYTSSSMPPKRTNYSRRIHRDVPTTRMGGSLVTNIGATILLDDFTLQNGASYVLEGSHRLVEAPSEKELDEKAFRLVAPAGSVLFFDALVWHAGGDNVTEAWRHALTINMCRPWMKQRLDLPRLLEGGGLDLGKMSPRVKQKLGFDAQVPASYDEYYAPPAKRKFKQKAE